MKEQIMKSLNAPETLERLFDENKKEFKKAFAEIYGEIDKYDIAKAWKARLDFEYEKEKAHSLQVHDLLILAGTCIIAGFLIHLPHIFGFNADRYLFYEKNAGIVFFFGLSLFTLWSGKSANRNQLLFAALCFLAAVAYINLLPPDSASQTVILACIHLPVLMWCLYGMIFTGFDVNSKRQRPEFIRHNGDMAVIGSLVILAGGALAAVTVGLFNVIDVKIEGIYDDYFIVWGLVSAPVITAFIVRNFPSISGNIAPVLARIFSPLVFITLLVFLATIPFSGKNPYSDRNFLLVFNFLLLGVLCLIIFSLSDRSRGGSGKLGMLVLVLLTMVTLIVDIIALTAIFHRLGEFGVSPNRIAILGSNLLVFIHLILILAGLYKISISGDSAERAESAIAGFAWYYIGWIIFVVFFFPLLFGFK